MHEIYTQCRGSHARNQQEWKGVIESEKKMLKKRARHPHPELYSVITMRPWSASPLPTDQLTSSSPCFHAGLREYNKPVLTPLNLNKFEVQIKEF